MPATVHGAPEVLAVLDVFGAAAAQGRIPSHQEVRAAFDEALRLKYEDLKTWYERRPRDGRGEMVHDAGKLLEAAVWLEDAAACQAVAWIMEREEDEAYCYQQEQMIIEPVLGGKKSARQLVKGRVNWMLERAFDPGFRRLLEEKVRKAIPDWDRP